MRGAAALLAAALLAACRGGPPPPEDWPERGDPLLAHAVWIEAGGRVGPGTIIHSSPERGTLVLTSAGAVLAEGAWLEPESEIEVGVPIEGGQETYPAEVISLGSASREPPEGPESELSRLSRLLGEHGRSVEIRRGADLAVLRLATDRLFSASSIETTPLDPPVEGTLLSIGPDLVPRARPATLSLDAIDGPESAEAAAGAAFLAGGKVIAVHGTGGRLSADQGALVRFLARAQATAFLVGGP